MAVHDARQVKLTASLFAGQVTLLALCYVGFAEQGSPALALCLGTISLLSSALALRLGARRADAVEQGTPAEPDDTFQGSTFPMFRATESGELIETNAAFRSFLKLGEEDDLDLSGLNVAEPISVSARRLARRDIVGSMRTKETFFTRKGEARDVIVYARLCSPEASGEHRIEGAAIDMTELYRIKRVVQASRQRFRRLYDETPVVLLSADREGIITDVNSFLLARFDVERTEIVGQPLTCLIAAEQRDDALAQVQQALQTSKRCTTDTHCLVDDERTFPARMYLNPRPARSTFGEALMVTLLDLTEIRQAQAQRDRVAQRLRVAERLEAVGQLAAAVAHEINTPSQYVLDNLEFLQEACAAMEHGLAAPTRGEDDTCDDDLQYYLDEYGPAIEQSLEGMREIKKIVGAMSRLTDPVNEQARAFTNLNELVENIATVACGEWRPVAELDIQLDHALDPTLCDPSAINQVVLNLIRNAAQAVADKGIEDGKGKISITTRQRERHAELVIEDSGCGIPPENLDRVLNPFFTTRELGEGTGQGLAIAHRIITEEHEGTLDVESELGAWTRLTIRLPQETDREAA